MISKSNNALAIFLFVALLFSACNAEKENSKAETPSRGRVVETETTVTFLSEAGEAVKQLQVAVADEPMERNQGLMDVREMPENVGMLFIFEENNPKSFYMANTLIPLDIMYVNSDSVIVRIYQNTTPFSSEPLPSGAPAQFVVETNGGYSIAHGITEGMKVRF